MTLFLNSYPQTSKWNIQYMDINYFSKQYSHVLSISGLLGQLKNLARLDFRARVFVTADWIMGLLACEPPCCSLISLQKWCFRKVLWMVLVQLKEAHLMLVWRSFSSLSRALVIKHLLWQTRLSDLWFWSHLSVLGSQSLCQVTDVISCRDKMTLVLTFWCVVANRAPASFISLSCEYKLWCYSKYWMTASVVVYF